jgi:hypothetical protein
MSQGTFFHARVPWSKDTQPLHVLVSMPLQVLAAERNPALATSPA